MPEHFALNMLGGFTVVKNSEPLALPPSCQRVVALAALKRRPLHRHWVCSTLWPDSPPKKAVASLRSALWRLRPLGAEALIDVEARSICLAPDVPVDWHDAVDSIDGLLADGSAAATDPDRVSALLPLLRAGELLHGWNEHWCAADRNRYRALRHSAFETLRHGSERHGALHGCGTARGHNRGAARKSTRNDANEP